MEIGAKYLDYLQAAISRMAGHGFTAKGWSITLATALLGIAVKDSGRYFAIVGLVPVILFWAIDAYFLVLEKRFRGLFPLAAQAVLAGNPVSFDMSPSAVSSGDVIAAAMRPALLL